MFGRQNGAKGQLRHMWLRHLRHVAERSEKRVHHLRHFKLGCLYVQGFFQNTRSRLRAESSWH